MGRIQKVNNGTEQVFGFKKQELIGYNIKELMPKIIGRSHDRFMNEYIEIGKAHILGNYNHMFGRQKAGFNMKISLLVQQIPSLNSGTQFVGMMRKLTEKYDYIITDQCGIIDSVSLDLNRLLNFPSSNILQFNQINIRLLFPYLITLMNKRCTKISEIYDKYKLEKEGLLMNLYIPDLFFEAFGAAQKKGKLNSSYISDEDDMGSLISSPVLHASFIKYNNLFNAEANYNFMPKSLLDLDEYQSPISRFKLKVKLEQYVLPFQKGNFHCFIYLSIY